MNWVKNLFKVKEKKYLEFKAYGEDAATLCILADASDTKLGALRFWQQVEKMFPETGKMTENDGWFRVEFRRLTVVITNRPK